MAWDVSFLHLCCRRKLVDGLNPAIVRAARFVEMGHEHGGRFWKRPRRMPARARGRFDAAALDDVPPIAALDAVDSDDESKHIEEADADSGSSDEESHK